jgi:carboxypeptidase C (cathepsin A)
MSKYIKNPLYITGESYAGVYVPTIVREILKDPQEVNLVGFAVGDGCMGTEVSFRLQ